MICIYYDMSGSLVELFLTNNYIIKLGFTSESDFEYKYGAVGVWSH